MLDNGFIKFLLGWRKMTICSSKSTEELRKLLEPLVTENAPHGKFRDWPSAKPFMGIVNDSGFNLREKTKFGQGWPAMVEGRFHQGNDQLKVSVSLHPTKPELLILCAVYLFAPTFILIGIFAQGTPSDPITLVDRAFAIGIPMIMLAFGWHDFSERTERVKQTLTNIFEISTQQNAE